MAALTHYSKIDATRRSNTATALTEVTQYTIPWTDLTAAGFAAGDDTLMICQVSFGGSGGNALEFTMRQGTTFAGSGGLSGALHDETPAAVGAADFYNVFWMDRHTLVDSNNLYFSMHSAAGDTKQADDFSFIILRLNDLTENVDFKFAESVGMTDAPTSYDTAGPSVTIPAANEDWLVLAHVRWLIDSTTADLFTDLHVDGVSHLEQRDEGANTSDDYLVGIIDALASPANGATIRARFHTDSAASHDANLARLFLLRLGAFENHAVVRSTSTITHSVLDTFQEFAGFPTFALDTTGDVAFFAQSRHVYNENTKAAYGRLEVGGAEVVAGYRRANARAHLATSLKSVTFALVAAQTAGTLDIDFDIAEDIDVTPTYSATEHSAIVFSMQLASGAATVVPAVIPVVTTLPTPAVLAAVLLAPAVIPVVASLPTPLIAAAATVAPATIAVVAALPTPSVVAGSVVVPAVIPLVVTLPTPVAGAPTIVSPAVVAVTATLPTPSILAASKVTPAVIPLAALLPTPTATDSASSVVTPAVIAATVGLPTPLVSVDAVVTPAGIAVVVTLPTSGVTTPGLVTPAGISVVVALPTPLATVGAITFWEPDPVAFVRIGPGDQPPWN